MLFSVLSTYLFFFFNDTATTEIYTLSLHDALPIYHETNINIIARRTGKDVNSHTVLDGIITTIMDCVTIEDRKSGSAGMPRPISYAVFCLKKKNINVKAQQTKAKNNRYSARMHLDTQLLGD